MFPPCYPGAYSPTQGRLVCIGERKVRYGDDKKAPVLSESPIHTCDILYSIWHNFTSRQAFPYITYIWTLLAGNVRRVAIAGKSSMIVLLIQCIRLTYPSPAETGVDLYTFSIVWKKLCYKLLTQA